MNFVSRLRGRVAITLAAVVVPAAAIILFWTIGQDRAIHEFQDQANGQALELLSARVGRLFDQSLGLKAALVTLQPEVLNTPSECAEVLTAFLAQHPGYRAAAVYRGSDELCRNSAFGKEEAWLTEEHRRQMQAQLDKGATPALAAIPGESGYVLMGLNGQNPQAGDFQVVLVVSRMALERRLDLKPFVSTSWVAIVDQSGALVAERRSGARFGKGDDVIVSTADSASGVPEIMARSGSDSRPNYVMLKLEETSASVVISQTSHPLIQTENERVWEAILRLCVLLIATTVGAVWAIDRIVVRWVHYLRRIAQANSKGRYTVRAKRLEGAPVELVELGEALNEMADAATQHTATLEGMVEEKAMLLRELHHRVKTNFQIIASLLSLHKKSLPGDRQEDIRFVEEHVHSMAAAYRVAYGSGDVQHVLLAELLKDVVSGLQETAKLAPQRLSLDIDSKDIRLDLDRAIALGLYLAALLPPLLDRYRASVETLRITVLSIGPNIRITLGGIIGSMPQATFLRERLISAYLRQLDAKAEASPDGTTFTILMPIEVAMAGKPR